MILNCNCSVGPFGNKNAAIFQDALYGTGNRVHTPMAKEDSYRCTICLHERSKKGAGDDTKGKKDKNSEKSEKKLAKSKS